MTIELTPAELKARLRALGLFGLIACCDEIVDKPWLRDVLAIEERERKQRGLDRRTETRTSVPQTHGRLRLGVAQEDRSPGGRRALQPDMHRDATTP